MSLSRCAKECRIINNYWVGLGGEVPTQREKGRKEKGRGKRRSASDSREATEEAMKGLLVSSSMTPNAY